MGEKTGEFFQRHGMTLMKWVIAAAIGYGASTVRLKWDEDRIEKLEQANPEELRWQVVQNVDRIKAIEAEGKATQREISDIKSQISSINAKLDAIMDLLKSHRQEYPGRS